MGDYSHYFHYQKPIPVTQWIEIVAGVVECIKRAPEFAMNWNQALGCGDEKRLSSQRLLRGGLETVRKVGSQRIFPSSQRVPVVHEPHDNLSPDFRHTFFAEYECLTFNGREDLKLNGMEFWLYRRLPPSHIETEATGVTPNWWNPGFCATYDQPYDLLVCAALILTEHYAPGCKAIRSDGDAADWELALAFVRTVMNDDSIELPPKVVDPSVDVSPTPMAIFQEAGPAESSLYF